MAALTTQYHFVRLFYEVAFLDGRRRVGMALTADEEDRLSVLISIVGRDPDRMRRRFRRKPMLMPAIVKGPGGVARATVVNMSPGGMLMVTGLDVEVGELVLVKVGRPGSVQHSFPCKAVRVEEHDSESLVALTVTGIPLEVRYGGFQTRELEMPRERVTQPLDRIRNTG